MKIYISHSSNFDFDGELYNPIKTSSFAKKYHFYFPHDKKNIDVDARPTIKNCDLIVAEVSRPSTGQGIELGWAYSQKIPICCIYFSGSNISSSLMFITDEFIEYNSKDNMLQKLEDRLTKL